MCNCTSGNLEIPGSRYRAPRNDRLPIPPVDRRHLQFCQLDTVDAADVQRHYRGAVGLAAVREHLDAAVDAELMADRVLVEQIFLQIILAGAHLKTLSAPRR